MIESTVRNDPACAKLRRLHRAYRWGIALAASLFVVGAVGAVAHELTVERDTVTATAISVAGDTTYAAYAGDDGTTVTDTDGRAELIAVPGATRPGDSVELPGEPHAVAALMGVAMFVAIVALLVSAMGANELAARAPQWHNPAFLPLRRLPAWPTRS